MSGENSRHQDVGLLSWLRTLQSRIERLEKGDKGVRVNDTRLGDLVLTPNSTTNQIEATNLKTGLMTPITSFRETVFSWSGAVELGASDTENESPPECIPDNTIANELILSRTGVVTANLAVAFIFGDLEVHMGLSAGNRTQVKHISVGVNRNDLVHVRLLCVSGTATNLSATVRYGQPFGDANNGPDTLPCVIPP